MNKSTIPVYQVETCEDIDYRQIFSEINVGESFIVSYDKGDQFTCVRKEDWYVFIPAQHGIEDTHVAVNDNYEWRA